MSKFKTILLYITITLIIGVPVYKVMADIGGSGISGGGTSSSVTGLTAANNVAITGGNVTGITNLGAANAVFTASNTTGVMAANVLNVSGIASFSNATNNFGNADGYGSIYFPLVTAKSFAKSIVSSAHTLTLKADGSNANNFSRIDLSVASGVIPLSVVGGSPVDGTTTYASVFGICRPAVSNASFLPQLQIKLAQYEATGSVDSARTKAMFSVEHHQGTTWVDMLEMKSSGTTGIPAAYITEGSGTGITVLSSGTLIQQLYKVTTTYAAYTDSDLTKGIVIATLPAKTRLVAAYADTTVAYAGTDITGATLEVGVTAEGASEILATGNVFAGAILLGDADAEMGTSMTRAAKEQGAYMPSFTGTTAIYATIDATTGAATTLANLTAGSTTFYLITERLP